jgi:hypothetical protein
MDITKEQLKQIGQILFNENSWSQKEIDELELKIDDILNALKQVNVDLADVRLSFISIEKAVNDLNLNKKIKWYVEENGELCRKGKLCPEPVIVNGRPVLINEA